MLQWHVFNARRCQPRSLAVIVCHQCFFQLSSFHHLSFCSIESLSLRYLIAFNCCELKAMIWILRSSITLWPKKVRFNQFLVYCLEIVNWIAPPKKCSLVLDEVAGGLSGLRYTKNKKKTNKEGNNEQRKRKLCILLFILATSSKSWFFMIFIQCINENTKLR